MSESEKKYFIKDSGITWKEAETLEDTIRKSFADGSEDLLLPLLSSFPEARREFYRKIWAEELKKRKKGA